MNGRPLAQPASAHLHMGPPCNLCSKPRAANLMGQLSHISGTMWENIVPELFRDILLPVLTDGWEGLQRVEIRGVMKIILADMRKKLAEKGVVFDGDGWQYE
jgi:hypothetical protein